MQLDSYMVLIDLSYPSLAFHVFLITCLDVSSCTSNASLLCRFYKLHIKIADSTINLAHKHYGKMPTQTALCGKSSYLSIAKERFSTELCYTIIHPSIV